MISVFFLLGCQKDYKKPIELLKFSSKQEAKIYLNQKLNQYGEALAKLAQNPKIRKFVNQKVAQKFDGDYNVLLRDLVSRQGMGLDQTKTMSDEPGEPVDPGEPSEPVEPADMEALADLLIEPLVIGTDTLYPQIYIPFYAEHMELEEQEDPCPSSEGSPTIEYPYPVIVIHDGEEIPGQDTFTGYSFDASGADIDGIVVDECFAQKHVVWAVTINERVNGSGIIPNVTGGTSGSGTATFPDLFIQDVIFKTDKESWVKGANEVYMQYGYSWENGVNPSTGNVDLTKYRFLNTNPLQAYSAPSAISYLMWENEIFLADVTNKNIKKKKVFNLNRTISNSISSYYPTKGTHLFLVVYERDGLLSAIFGGGRNPNINGFSTGMSFVSNDPQYLGIGLEIVSKSSNRPQPNTDYAHIINSEIDFKSLYR